MGEQKKTPKWNPNTGQAKYPTSIHHSEVKRNTKSMIITVPIDGGDLAAEYGMNLALESLKDRH